jgi:hypothetical protein
MEWSSCGNHQFGSVPTIIRLVALDEAPSVNIDNLPFVAIVAAEQVKPAYSLTKSISYTSSP